MAISIALTHNRSTYYPGEKVSGIVRLVAESELDVEKVDISFRGIAETHIVFVKYFSAQSNFNKRVIFFSREATLFSGPYTLKTGSYEWPFDFTIPSNCESDVSQDFQDKKSLLFNHAAVQDLPPSFDQVKSKKFRTSGNSFGIFYPLKATLKSAGRAFGHKDAEALINLNVQTTRDEEHPSWSTVTQLCRFKGRRTESASAGRRSSIVDVLRGRRGSTDSTPTFEFALSAQIPSTIIIKKPIPIFLTLQYDEEALITSVQNLPSLPEIDMKSIHVDLETENIIRCQGSGQQPYYSGCPESNWILSTPLDTKLAHAIELENGRMLDLRTILPDMMIPASETPTFSSFSIVRLHELKIRVELECSGEQLTASFAVKRVFVLPEAYRRPESPNADPNFESSDGKEEGRALATSDGETAAPAGGEDPPSFEAATITTPAAPRYDEGDELPAYAREETY